MKPEQRSATLLAITRSKAKMFEYGLPEQDHIAIPRDPARLMRLTVGILGDHVGGTGHDRDATVSSAEASGSLRFAARYFDAYVQSQLAGSQSPHVLLLASAAYYLCDFSGSAQVLAQRVSHEQASLAAGGLGRLLCWLLQGNFSAPLLAAGDPRYGAAIDGLAAAIRAFYHLTASDDGLLRRAVLIRKSAYDDGTARELLFADACYAVVAKRIRCSARVTLPAYSGVPMGAWAPVLRKSSFVSELWPAQRLLGEEAVFAGRSAVVQMPTSAGKSRATEIIIRSAFLRQKTSLCVVVGPFRALCHEIREGLSKAFQGEDVSVNELSDAFQRDFVLDDVIAGRTVLVMTPEKLAYMLRHVPTLGAHIGVLVLDEGHQFDAGSRGVTYELLITSLKAMIPATAQTLLISAVITNAKEISKWLNGDEGVVVTGSELLPTERSVAFASWQTQLGQLHFVAPTNPDDEEFFVPRVIRSSSLRLRARERTPRFFPERDDHQSVALYLGLRLVVNGAVALFCGRKDTATGVCDTLVDVFDRGLGMTKPLDVSDPAEIVRLYECVERNLGSRSSAVAAAKLGVFTHHGNTPHGIRLAVEHAIKEGLARFVVCTSTLAQGVNLPIRYLIVTSDRQGGEKIKVRDFHNLMGRAGRSGMHTEGSVLIANPDVYDTRRRPDSKWPEFKALLQVENSEPCASTLLSVLNPLGSDGGQVQLQVDPLLFVRDYVADDSGSGGWVDTRAAQLTRQWFSTETLRRQLASRRQVFGTVESFLLAHWAGDGQEPRGTGTPAELAARTLAYHLASVEQRAQLVHMFELLGANVQARVPTPERRTAFGRTLFGSGQAAALEQWVAVHRDEIRQSVGDENLFATVWPGIDGMIENGTFAKWAPLESKVEFAKRWMAGESFGALYESMLRAKVRIGLGAKPRSPKVEHAVEMGESALGFDGAHVLGAIVELYELARPEDDVTILRLQRLQKRLKYGLPSLAATVLYEAGFADRPLAQSLALAFPGVKSRVDAKGVLRQRRVEAEQALDAYPVYFRQVFEHFVG